MGKEEEDDIIIPALVGRVKIFSEHQYNQRCIERDEARDRALLFEKALTDILMLDSSYEDAGFIALARAAQALADAEDI